MYIKYIRESETERERVRERESFEDDADSSV